MSQTAKVDGTKLKTYRASPVPRFSYVIAAHKLFSRARTIRRAMDSCLHVDIVMSIVETNNSPDSCSLLQSWTKNMIPVHSYNDRYWPAAYLFHPPVDQSNFFGLPLSRLQCTCNRKLCGAFSTKSTRCANPQSFHLCQRSTSLYSRGNPPRAMTQQPSIWCRS